jgi:hypothetical protein
VKKPAFLGTIPSPNLKNDFYGCWVEAVTQEMRWVLRVAHPTGTYLNPTYKEMAKVLFGRETGFFHQKKPGFLGRDLKF